MSSHDQPLIITGPESQDMLGILSLPASDTQLQSIGVVIVVGGAQYRVGSHRQFVQLARFLAAAGYAVLRFDFPGMGDSPGELVPFDESAAHIAAAIDAMRNHSPKVDRIVLWGLCDGASASLLYGQARQDSRVAGMVLLNPWIRSDAGLARARVKHYYLQRLLEPSFWRKLAAGAVGWHALRGLGSNLRTMRQKAPKMLIFQELMAHGWRSFEGKIMLILSGHDLTSKEFMEHAQTHAAWRGLLSSPSVTQYVVHEADHTFSSPLTQREVEAATLAWMGRLNC